MDERAFVVVFPSIFARGKQSLLIQNIRKILKMQNQPFSRITRDGDIIIVDANDPVFASSAINLLFGVSRICIARQVENKFDTVVSEIAKIGSSLLLRGEQFHVKVEGHASGYIPKDVEVAATSALIEGAQKSDCRPGTEEKHDKQIFCFLTRKNAYVSIFLDEGHGGVPYNAQGQKILCCIHDELSAVACLEAVKQGFDVRVILCYSDSNLHDLAKMVNRIIPRIVRPEVPLEFFKMPKSTGSAKSVLQRSLVASHIMCDVAKKGGVTRVGLALCPLVHPAWFIDKNSELVRKSGLSPWVLLAGIDQGIIKTAKEIGLGKYLGRLEKLGALYSAKESAIPQDTVQKAKKSGRGIILRAGPNNVHEMLDFVNH